MSSLFRKPKKNIQRRANSDFPEDPDQPTAKDHVESEKPAMAAKIKVKEPKPEKKERKSTKTLLSFGDEEGMLCSTNIYRQEGIRN